MDVEFIEIAKKQILQDEDLRLFPYRCSEGKLTIGVGHNLEDNGISRAAAMLMYHEDLHEAVRGAWLNVECFRSLSDKRKAAVVNMFFVLGQSRFRTFKKFLAALNEGDFNRAADEMIDSKWHGQATDRVERLAQEIREG